MENHFIPYEQALELKELGFDEECLKWYVHSNNLSDDHIFLIGKDEHFAFAPLYQQAFAFFRNRFGYTYSIGRTNICVYHLMVQGTLLTNMIQGCKSYEEAELKCIQEFINAAKQNS